MKSADSLFIFAGEPSGDRHGAEVLEQMKLRRPELTAIGVGGPALRSAGLNILIPTEEFCVMGFTDVIKALPRLCRHFYTVRNHILHNRPKVVLLIDYPGFNLRLAKSLRKKGYQGKIIQYVAPMVWAWGSDRIAKMEKVLDLLLVIYPFETSVFSASTLPTQYVGNPVSEALSKYTEQSNWRKCIGLPLNQAPLSLFPGSRQAEIERNFPLQLAAAALLQKEEPNLPIAISLASNDHLPLILAHLERSGLQPNSWKVVPSHYRYELMRASQAAIAKSGTVTLELALHGCPTVVTYVLTRLNRCLARYWMKLSLDYFCIVNVLANKQIFPELIAEEPTAEKIATQLRHLLNNQTSCRQECAALRNSLCTKQASVEVALHVERLCLS